MELKTLSEINQMFVDEFSGHTADKQATRKPHISFVRVLSDILFYLAVFVVLYCALSVDKEGNRSRNIMGFSHYTVMSSSMNDEIPKGSLIIIRETKPADLKSGDNITFTKDSGITVTHKIIEVFDSYPDAGRRFQTKGVNNANPDAYTVPEEDVLGKVVFVLPGAGTLIHSLNENLHIVLIFFLLCSMLSFLLRSLSGSKKYVRRH